jgi:2-oxoglutarate dehydrogenase E1 component
MKDFSYITHSHPSYIENLYKDYIQNPENVDPEFRKFFEGFDFAFRMAMDMQLLKRKQVSGTGR